MLLWLIACYAINEMPNYENVFTINTKEKKNIVNWVLLSRPFHAISSFEQLDLNKICLPFISKFPLLMSLASVIGFIIKLTEAFFSAVMI